MSVLVVSPHPDDETLGACGTLLKYKELKQKVFWLNVTDIENDENYSNEQRKKRKQQIEMIQDFYSFDDFCNLKLKTTFLDTYNDNDVIPRISRFIEKTKPEIVILPDYNDAHSDHKIVFEWCYACTKVFRYPFVKQIQTMEILSETNFGKPMHPFIPNLFIDISKYIDKKYNAVKIYDTELGNFPFPRSQEAVEALAKLRGVLAGVQYAEAFRIIKRIEK